jgi:hypothetical protein
VAELATRRYADREATTRARQAREQRKPLPPEGDHEWLTASQAARVLGMSPMGSTSACTEGPSPTPTIEGATGSAATTWN